jgi:hypothetical protein
MTQDEEEQFKIVDYIMWREAERNASTLGGRLPVAQVHRTMWRLLEKGRIFLATDDSGEQFRVRYLPWWRWRTRRDYAANVQWLIAMHKKRMMI